MSKARTLLSSSKDLILRIFDYQCIMCGRPTREVHEIIPISHGRVALAGRNRVPLCGFPYENSCHDWAHKIGTRNSIPILQEKRAEFLRQKWLQRTASSIYIWYDETPKTTNELRELLEKIPHPIRSR